MEYMNVVRSDFEEFAKENVEGYEHSKTLMMPEYVSKHGLSTDRTCSFLFI